jgi:hypothetical protein
MTRAVLATVAVLALSTAVARADGYEKTEKKPGALVRLHVDRTTLRLSDALFVTVTVEGVAPLEVDPIPTVVADRKNWDEAPVGEPEIGKLPGGWSRWRQSFRVEPLNPEVTELSLTPVRFRAGGPDQSWLEQPWAKVPVKITTDVVVAAAGELKDIQGIQHLPAEPGVDWRPLAAAGGLVAVGLGFLAVRRLRRRWVRRAPELTPSQRAVRALDEIEALDLPGAGDVEQYHTRVSDVLRRYLEARFGWRAPEQTTPEFLSCLQKSDELPAELQGLLREFLQRCDLAKFARADFTPSECRQAGRMAREFVEQSSRTLPDSAKVALKT